MQRFPLVIAFIALAALIALNAGLADAYVKIGCSWPDPTHNYDKDSLGNAWEDAVWNGAKQWNQVTPSDFKWTAKDSGGNDITLGAVDGSGGTLAVTTTSCFLGVMLEADIEFDNAESWYKGTGAPGAGQFDAFSVAAHEFGHALGLDHTNLSCSGVPSSKPTMCPSVAATETFMRTLHSDDKAGLNDMYP